MNIWDFLNRIWPSTDTAGKLDTIIATQKEQQDTMSDVFAKVVELKKDTERLIAEHVAIKSELEILKAQIAGNEEALQTLAKVEGIIDATDAAVEQASPEPPPVEPPVEPPPAEPPVEPPPAE